MGAGSGPGGVRPGDANLDGRVDVLDLRLSARFIDTDSDATWAMGNFNGDGMTNVADILILNANFGFGVTDDPLGLYSEAQGRAAAPEPAALGAVFGLSALLIRRRDTREFRCSRI